MSLLSSIKDAVAEKILLAIIGKFADLTNSILTGITNGIIADVNPSNMDTFFEWIGYKSTTFSGNLENTSWLTYNTDGNAPIDLFAAFALIGFVIAILIFVLNLFSLGLGDVVDVKESPMIMIARFGIAIILVSNSNTIISVFLTVSGSIWEAIFKTSLLTSAEPVSSLGELYSKALFDYATAVPNLLVSLICGIIIIKKMVSYLVDLMASYLMMMFLYMILPACAGTFASKKTDVLGAYFKMLLSTYFVTITRIVMFRFALLSVTAGVFAGNRELIIGPINDCLITLAFLELGNRCDAVLKSIGLSPAATGGRLLDSLGAGARSLMNDALMPMRMYNNAGKMAGAVGTKAMNDALANGDHVGAAKAAMVASMGDKSKALQTFMEAQRKNGVDQYQAAANAKKTGMFDDVMSPEMEGMAKVGEAMQTLKNPNTTDKEKKDAISKFAEGYAAAHGVQVPEGKDLDRLLNNNGIHMSDEFKYGENGYMDLDEEMRHGNKEAENFYKNDSGYTDAVNDLRSGKAMEDPERMAQAFNTVKEAMERMNGGPMTDAAVAQALHLNDPEMLYGKNGIANREGADGSINLDDAMEHGDRSAQNFYKQSSGYNDAMNYIKSGNAMDDPEKFAKAFDTIKSGMERMNGGPMTDAAVAREMHLNDPQMLYGKGGIANREGADGSVNLDKALSPKASEQERRAAVSYMNSLGSMEEKRAAAPETIAAMENKINEKLGSTTGRATNMKAENVTFNNDGSVTAKMTGDGMPSVNASVGADGNVTPLADNGRKAGEGASHDTKNWYDTKNDTHEEGGARMRSNSVHGAEQAAAYFESNGVSADDAYTRFGVHFGENVEGQHTMDFGGTNIDSIEKTHGGLNFNDDNGETVGYTATDRNTGEEVTAKVPYFEDVMNTFEGPAQNESILRQTAACGAIDRSAFESGDVGVVYVGGQKVSDMIGGVKSDEVFTENTFAFVSTDAQGNQIVTGYMQPIMNSEDVNAGGRNANVVYDKNDKNAGAYRVYKNDDFSRRQVTRQRTKV